MKTRLNLIPEYRKKEISQKSLLMKILRWELEFTFIFFLFIALLFSIGYILKLDLLTNTIKLSPDNISKFKDFKQYDGEIKEMNSKVAEVKKIQIGQIYWSNFLMKLSDMTHEEITITSVASKDLAISLSGISNSREDLIIFKEKLEGDACFADVNLPLSYLVSRENLPFQIDLNIKKECLTKNNGK